MKNNLPSVCNLVSISVQFSEFAQACAPAETSTRVADGNATTVDIKGIVTVGASVSASVDTVSRR